MDHWLFSSQFNTWIQVMYKLNNIPYCIQKHFVDFNATKQGNHHIRTTLKWQTCTPDQLIASTQGSGQAPSAEVRSPPFLPRCAALAAAPEQVICAGVHPSHHRRRGTRPGRCSNTVEGVGGPLLGLGVNSVEEADIPHYLDSWLNKRYSLCIVPELVNECLQRK